LIWKFFRDQIDRKKFLNKTYSREFNLNFKNSKSWLLGILKEKSNIYTMNHVGVGTMKVLTINHIVTHHRQHNKNNKIIFTLGIANVKILPCLLASLVTNHHS
jgi:hypothetical protein